MGSESISGREEIAFPCKPLPSNDREKGIPRTPNANARPVERSPFTLRARSSLRDAWQVHFIFMKWREAREARL